MFWLLCKGSSWCSECTAVFWMQLFYKDSFVCKEKRLKSGSFTFVRVDKCKEGESHETECNICWASRCLKCGTDLIVGFQPVKVRGGWSFTSFTCWSLLFENRNSSTASVCYFWYLLIQLLLLCNWKICFCNYFYNQSVVFQNSKMLFLTSGIQRFAAFLSYVTVNWRFWGFELLFGKNKNS